MFTANEPLKIAIALGTVLLVFVTMYRSRNAPTEILFSMALALFVVCGIIAPEKAWHCYADPSVIAIGGLLVVSAALRSSGALDLLGRSLLGNVKSERSALGRLSAVVVAGSAFLLNTALVAMLLPLVISWCRRNRISPSKLLLPISYFAILGGTCTLVGTSTNFVINGMFREFSHEVDARLALPDAPTPAGVPNSAGTSKTDAQQTAASDADASGAGPGTGVYSREWLTAHRADLRQMHLFEISNVGVPCAIAGALFLIFLGRRWLPDRSEMLDSLEEQRREYLVEMTVTAECPLIGKTVEEGGMRHLPGLFLFEIERAGRVITPVAPTDRILKNDRLGFTGVLSTIIDLEGIPGLVPAADMNYEIAPEKAATRSLVEVVLSPTSPLVGSTIRQANFRQHYGAAVVAVHRNGKHLPSKIGDIELSPGDTLLLQTQQSFIRNFRNRPDFYLVSGVESSDARRPDKLLLAILIAGGLLLWLFAMPLLPSALARIYPAGIPDVLTLPSAAILVAAMLMIATRCLSVSDARRAIDLPLLLTIGAAIGVGRGISDCGAAGLIASGLSAAVGSDEMVGLVIVFVLTVLFTEMISNVAVAAMMFYVAIELASHMGASPRPFVMAVTLAASLSFISPIGYQTNLLVMGPGGYRPIDYAKVGVPLTLLVGTIAVILIPQIWPF